MLFMISGSLLLMTASGVMNLNALLDRFHNYILPYVRGEERICGCKCGRHNIYHVIPYDGDESRVHSRSVGERVTKQEIDLMLGLLIGFCLTWCLLWLDGAVNSVLRAWRAKQHNDVDSWSWVHTLCNIKELCRRGHWRQMGDSSGNGMHVKQTLIHNCHHKPRHLLE